jgi:MoaA/NifB/PqqE/SkfB family radical SAM enzyme
LEAIENIKKIKPSIQLINHTVITSKNFEDLEKHVEHIINLGFVRIDLLNMMPNTSLNKDLFVSPSILAPKIISIIDRYSSKIKIEVCYTQPCFYK